MPPPGFFDVGYCRRCGSLLFDPKFIHQGFGLKCLQEIKKA
jgi:hypothetical protein